MKEKILELLRYSKKALTLTEIKDALEINSTPELTELVKVLIELEKTVDVYRTNKDKYMIFGDSHLKKGILSVNKKGFGFVDLETEPDIYVDLSNMNGAIHGDLVIVEILKTKSDARPEGRIIRVISRNINYFVGEVIEQDGKTLLKLDDQKVKLIIYVDKNQNKDVMPGHKVLVETGEPLGKNSFMGKIIKVIGHKNDPGVDILSIVYKYGINDVFNEKITNEISNIPNEVSAKEIQGRRDLRNAEIFTIDGDDTKDIDDAISIEKLPNGNYKLGVHIADVSYYVKENSEIDKEAYDRGTSVYLVDRVIPMLPHKLSNGICSLNPNVDRLAVTCDMEINAGGHVVNYEIYESVIKSKIQMTYKKVNKILENNEMVEGYEPYINSLKMMGDLATILRQYKLKRGYLDFDTNEAKILVDEAGKPYDVVLRDRGVGENLIEDFMIVANETVASHIFWLELPFLYRIHEYPKEPKVASFLAFVSALGYPVKGNLKDLHPKVMQKILDTLRDKPEYPILSTLLLRTMQKAVYRPENVGHYGLASEIYTHFTSPIRRYPDTTVHRLLRTYLFEGKTDVDTLKYWRAKLVPLCEHSSKKERDSVDCERDVDSMKMAEYMENHIGEEFEGMISSVMNFGFFVQLPNLIEGLIHVQDMTGDYYHFDEKRLTLRGERSKKEFRIGDPIKVKVKGASKENSTIDFELTEADQIKKKEHKIVQIPFLKKEKSK